MQLRITKLDIEMFHQQSWKPITLGVKKSKVKGQRSRSRVTNPARCGLLHTLVEWCWPDVVASCTQWRRDELDRQRAAAETDADDDAGTDDVRAWTACDDVESFRCRTCLQRPGPASSNYLYLPHSNHQHSQCSTKEIVKYQITYISYLVCCSRHETASV